MSSSREEIKKKELKHRIYSTLTVNTSTGSTLKALKLTNGSDPTMWSCGKKIGEESYDGEEKSAPAASVRVAST